MIAYVLLGIFLGNPALAQSQAEPCVLTPESYEKDGQTISRSFLAEHRRQGNEQSAAGQNVKDFDQLAHSFQVAAEQICRKARGETMMLGAEKKADDTAAEKLGDNKRSCALQKMNQANVDRSAESFGRMEKFTQEKRDELLKKIQSTATRSRARVENPQRHPVYSPATQREKAEKLVKELDQLYGEKNSPLKKWLEDFRAAASGFDGKENQLGQQSKTIDSIITNCD